MYAPYPPNALVCPRLVCGNAKEVSGPKGQFL